jgi:hypothetical protein
MRWPHAHVFVISLVFLGLVIPGAIQGATAQETMPVAQPVHPIVGTWTWDNNPDAPGTDVSYAIFHADGTYVETTTFNGTALGAWEPIGDRAVILVETFLDTDESPAIAPGTATFLIALTVDERGDVFTGLGAVQVRSPGGEVTFEANRLTFTGRRVVVAPLPDFGAWTAATPAAGTPRPSSP